MKNETGMNQVFEGMGILFRMMRSMAMIQLWLLKAQYEVLWDMGAHPEALWEIAQSVVTDSCRAVENFERAKHDRWDHRRGNQGDLQKPEPPRSAHYQGKCTY